MNQFSRIIVPAPPRNGKALSGRRPAQEHLAASVVSELTQGVLVLDRRLRVVLCNPATQSVLGTDTATLDSKPLLPEFLNRCARLGPSSATALLESCRRALTADVPPLRLPLEVSDPASARFHRLPGQRCLVLLNPVSAEPAQAGGAEATAETAGVDPLTGIANRRGFRQFLDGLCNQETNGPETPALLVLDLDRFRAINDTLGHSVGDALLCSAVQRLQIAVGTGDLLARLGGDEFAIVLRSSHAAEQVAERVVDLLARPFLVHGHLAQIAISVGLAFAADGDDPNRLMRKAELALQQAKAEGRGRWKRFSPDMEDRANDRRQLEFDLRKAIALRELELHYQPQTCLASGRLLGFEALVRWRSPSRGLVAPGLFVPLAEEIGFIRQIGAWVVRSACNEACRWPSPLSVAVNVSPHQLTDGSGLMRTVTQALAESGLAAHRLELEITESALIQPEQGILQILRDIHELGIRISMDDFGTGYSSLSQLRSFPFDKIKIDRSFIQDLARDAESAAVVRAIASLGEGLRMSTIAEGVETAEQASLVRNCGCEAMQGYFVSRPVPQQEVSALIGRLELECGIGKVET